MTSGELGGEGDLTGLLRSAGEDVLRVGAVSKPEPQR